MTEKRSLVPIESIQRRIFVIRNERVMIDRALAELYGVETKQLKRAVRRNLDRFPSDFMFELTKEEYDSLRCQIGTLKRGEHTKYLPMAFTEQGVAMLSSVVNSKQAIEVNILIMRAFVELRKMISSHKALLRKVEEMEKKYDEQFKVVFDAIRELMTPPEKPRKKIGFVVKERRAAYGKGAKRKKKRQSWETLDD
ncbi:MAG: ORF6N domain-containing protein [Deltaproteobacteria bacterium]|nr:ORF6N domain-containing protein [Deltaproteobacteria bacterium]MBW2020542.1 ORF6N domain-containing protein [Deltaproteobacteria bacterium]MBW2073957.1 ORF6N domain-containing protein [Deltaproteobacteria bacterium]RLB82200.1 MAG: ORF6N domain-containing protein [Deltaproteobacteria bacterium]